tara:strand:- start:238 stop:564 length:327 start_codon:yes stop_codon:yes gene_type:complete
MDYNKTWEVMNNLEESFNRIKALEDMVEDLVEAVNYGETQSIVDISHAINAYLPVFINQYDKASKRAWNNTVIKAAQEDVPYRRANWIEIMDEGGKYKDEIDLELEIL